MSIPGNPVKLGTTLSNRHSTKLSVPGWDRTYDLFVSILLSQRITSLYLQSLRCSFILNFLSSYLIEQATIDVRGKVFSNKNKSTEIVSNELLSKCGSCSKKNHNYYVYHGRVTLFFANNFLTECRFTMEFLHNFF